MIQDSLEDGHNGKIKKSVFCFSLYLVTMLFQTSLYNLGTVVALGAMICSMFFLLLETSRIRINALFVCLSIFLVYTLSVTVFKGNTCSISYLGQIAFCCIAISFKLNKHEFNYLKQAFINSMVFYSILIIISCIKNSSDRYFHGRIILFGSSMDPNFIGIPLVFALSLLAYQFLFSKSNRVCISIKFLVCFSAILFTASRGNLLAFIVDFTVCWIIFIQTKEKTKKKKLYLLCLTLLLVGLILFVAFYFFPQEISRMSNFSDGADNGRFDLWKESLNLWATSPVFGCGIGSNYSLLGFESHNTYLALLSETGLIGFILFSFVGLYTITMIRTVDYSLFVASLGLLAQVFFVDALDDRCVWALLTWFVMIVSSRNILIGRSDDLLVGKDDIE